MLACICQLSFMTFLLFGIVFVGKLPRDKIFGLLAGWVCDDLQSDGCPTLGAGRVPACIA